jgi:uncharacterized protein (TIGR03435 family)
MALALLTFGALAFAPRLAAQSPADAAASVEYVASIKRSTAPGGGATRMMPGRISTTGMPLRPLVRQAYGPLQDFQLVGGPDWIDTERFDIEVRLEGPPSQPMMQAMLRRMLAERFQLKTHTESRDLPVYELVLARDDGRLGPELKPSAPECVTMITTQGRGRGGPGDGRGTPPPPPPPLDDRGRGRGPGGPGPLAFDGPPPCGSRGGGFGRFRAGGTTMAQLAASLAGNAQRVIIDKTGLTGVYDVMLTYTPNPAQLPLAPPPPGVELPAIDPNGPSLFTAIQEQLGLKLESARAPVEVVVIDAIERPSEN